MSTRRDPDEDPSEEAPPRKRGGQPGNRNAMRHGFYSDAFSPEERELLRQALEIKSLQPDIAMLRVKIVRLLSYPDTPSELILQAARTLTRMVDVQDRITHGRS